MSGVGGSGVEMLLRGVGWGGVKISLSKGLRR